MNSVSIVPFRFYFSITCISNKPITFRAIYINLLGSIAILSLTCLTGLVAFAVYHKCDLLLSNKITKGEQVRIN